MARTPWQRAWQTERDRGGGGYTQQNQQNQRNGTHARQHHEYTKISRLTDAKKIFIFVSSDEGQFVTFTATGWGADEQLDSGHTVYSEAYLNLASVLTDCNGRTPKSKRRDTIDGRTHPS